ncbi:MAG: nucleotidyltransferase domain-containing protein [Planctomycetota bacterium]
MKASEEIERFVAGCVRRIENGYHPERIILFGSYAYGQPSEDSDVDFLIVKSTKDRPFDRRLQVARLISDPHRAVPVDLFVLTPEEIEDRLDAGDQFLQEILDKGEVVYARE